jgi:hypothetical protein
MMEVLKANSGHRDARPRYKRVPQFTGWLRLHTQRERPVWHVAQVRFSKTSSISVSGLVVIQLNVYDIWEGHAF